MLDATFRQAYPLARRAAQVLRRQRWDAEPFRSSIAKTSNKRA